jgi:hypothetical protein
VECNFFPDILDIYIVIYYIFFSKKCIHGSSHAMLRRGLPPDAAACAGIALQAHDPATDGDWNVRRLIALQGGSPHTLQTCKIQG